MNKELKIRLLIFIVNAIIFTSIGVIAETKISADKISYSDKETVKDKLDTLYTNQSTKIEEVKEENTNLYNEIASKNDEIESLTQELNELKSNDYSSIKIHLCVQSSATGYKEAVLDFENFKNYKYFKITGASNQNSTYSIFAYNDSTYTTKTDLEKSIQYLTDDFYRYYINMKSNSSDYSYACSTIYFYN